MKRQFFLLYDRVNKIYFTKCKFYGYDKYNKNIFISIFSEHIQDAYFFRSVQEALDKFDQFIISEYEIYLLKCAWNAKIKLQNIFVEPIGVVYDL